MQSKDTKIQALLPLGKQTPIYPLNLPFQEDSSNNTCIIIYRTMPLEPESYVQARIMKIKNQEIERLSKLVDQVGNQDTRIKCTLFLVLLRLNDFLLLQIM